MPFGYREPPPIVHKAIVVTRGGLNQISNTIRCVYDSLDRRSSVDFRILLTSSDSTDPLPFPSPLTPFLTSDPAKMNCVPFIVRDLPQEPVEGCLPAIVKLGMGLAGSVLRNVAKLSWAYDDRQSARDNRHSILCDGALPCDSELGHGANTSIALRERVTDSFVVSSTPKINL